MAMKTCANLPHLLMFIHIALYLESIDKMMNAELKQDYFAIREELGISRYIEYYIVTNTAPDIRDMPRTLTALGSAATDIGAASKTIAQHITILKEFSDEFGTLDPIDTNMALQERIGVLRLRNDELQASVQSMKDDVQSMVQMASISLSLSLSLSLFHSRI
jgi:hypothetical protein